MEWVESISNDSLWVSRVEKFRLTLNTSTYLFFENVLWKVIWREIQNLIFLFRCTTYCQLFWMSFEVQNIIVFMNDKLTTLKLQEIRTTCFCSICGPQSIILWDKGFFLAYLINYWQSWAKYRILFVRNNANVFETVERSVFTLWFISCIFMN